MIFWTKAHGSRLHAGVKIVELIQLRDKPLASDIRAEALKHFYNRDGATHGVEGIHVECFGRIIIGEDLGKLLQFW